MHHIIRQVMNNSSCTAVITRSAFTPQYTWLNLLLQSLLYTFQTISGLPSGRPIVFKRSNTCVMNSARVQYSGHRMMVTPQPTFGKRRRYTHYPWLCDRSIAFGYQPTVYSSVQMFKGPENLAASALHHSVVF